MRSNKTEATDLQAFDGLVRRLLPGALSACTLLAFPGCRATDSARPTDAGSPLAPSPLPAPPEPAGPEGLSAVVSPASLEVNGAFVASVPGEGARSQGFDPSVKRSGSPHDLFLVPLAAAVSAVPAARRSPARVTVDGAIPYRMVVEVLFTLGQNEVVEFDLGLSGAAQPRIVFRPPRVGGAARTPAELRGLHFAALLAKDGVALKASGGNIGPGCNGVGPGLAVARAAAGGPYDLAAVTACARKVKASAPEFAHERMVTVSADADRPMREVVELVIALRGTPSEPLFPEVTFAVSR